MAPKQALCYKLAVKRINMAHIASSASSILSICISVIKDHKAFGRYHRPGLRIRSQIR